MSVTGDMAHIKKCIYLIHLIIDVTEQQHPKLSTKDSIYQCGILNSFILWP